MPRAFCPECGSEVPVDTDGICHVGHVIDLSTANVRDDDAVGDASATASDDPNEPEPWVASVDTTTLGGYTPPPDAEAAAPSPQPPLPAEPATAPESSQPEGLSGLSGATDLPLPPSSPASPPPVMRAEPDAPAYEPGSDGSYDAATFELDGSDDLARAAAEAAAATPVTSPADEDDDVFEFSQSIDDPSAGDSLGWTPPTESPVAGAPVPPPAPVDPPAPAAGETLSGEFDLDDLEAAVSELSSDPTPVAPPATPEPELFAAPSSADDDLDVLSAFDEPEPAAPSADLPPPAATPTREIPPLAPPTGSPAPPTGEPAAPAAEAPAPQAPSEDDAPTPAHRLPAPDPGTSQEPEDVDLSNFTAKGGGGSSGSGGGGLKGLFRRR